MNSEMKPNPSWSVSGVSPEARDLARDAASREGMTVGDWLTKKIILDRRLAEDNGPGRPSRLEEDFYRMERDEQRGRDDQTRADRENLAVRIAKSEVETDSAFKRIDETLRAMARRLESSERSQNEASRTMSAAAAEINAATREQAEAFGHITDRITRVERSTDTGALRDAVRGLHQGMSRLADQIAKTANETSSQGTQLAQNVEHLHAKVAAAREESQRIIHALETRIQTLTDRMTTAEEKAASTPALHEKLGAIENLIAAKISAIESRVGASENTLQQNFAHQLAALEQNILEIAKRMEASDRRMADENASIDMAIKTLADRVDASEQKTNAGFQDIRVGLGEATKRIDTMEMAAPLNTATMAPVNNMFGEGMPDLEPPPFAEPPPFPAGSYGTPGPTDMFPPVSTFENSDTIAQPPMPELAPAPQPAHDYLSAARKAAQAAAQAEPQRGMMGHKTPRTASMGAAVTMGDTTIGSFDRPPPERRTSPLAAIVALVLLAAVAGFLLTRGFNFPFGSREAATQPATGGQITAPPASAPAATPDASSNTAEPAATTNDNAPPRPGTAYTNAPNDATPPRPATASGSPQTSTPPAAAPSPGIATGPAAVGAPVATAQSGPSPIDRLLSKAKAGDSAAQLVLGIKYLDGDGLPASDSEAVRWLKRSAEQGQPVAQYRLGTLFERGRGVAADAKQAVYWYLQAANAGNRKAMHNLAVAYADGTGADKNFTEAARWFKQASEMGLVDSQFNLAVLYERGLGVPASLSEAYKWYSIASAQGDTESKARIDALGTQLAPADRQNAERAAKTFRPKAGNPAANDTPDIADVAP